MKIYKVVYQSQQGGSEGCYFYTNFNKAKVALKKFKAGVALRTNQYDEDDNNDSSELSCIETLNYPVTAKGMIEALNKHATHNDNG